MKKLSLILSIILISSCKNSNEKIVSVSQDIDSATFENIVGAGYLKLNAYYDECGEWGGHHEEFKITRENNKLVAVFTKDSVNCKQPITRNVIEKKKIILTDVHKKAIEIYLHKLLNKSLQEHIPYHAGEWFSAETIDSSLIINYQEARNSWKGFSELKEKLSK